MFDLCKNCNHSHGAHDDDEGCSFCDCPSYIRTLHQLAEAKTPRPITFSDLRVGVIHDNSVLLRVRQLKIDIMVSFIGKSVTFNRIGSPTQDDIAKYTMIIKDPAQKKILIDFASNILVQSTIISIYDTADIDDYDIGDHPTLRDPDPKGYKPVSEKEIVTALLKLYKVHPDHGLIEHFINTFKKLGISLPDDVLKSFNKSINSAKAAEIQAKIDKLLRQVEALRAKLKQLGSE